MQLLDRGRLSLLHYSGLISLRASDEGNFPKLLPNAAPALQAHRLYKGLPSAKPAPTLLHYFVFILVPTDVFVMFS